MSETRTYRGATIEEVLPQIRAELGAQAVITRRREGVSGGIGGFFGKRCVEVEARSGLLDDLPTTPALPARQVFDAYDSAPAALPVEPEQAAPQLPNPVMQAMIEQAGPFAQQLREAVQAAPVEQQPQAPVERSQPAEPRFEPFGEFMPAFAGVAGAAPEAWQQVHTALLELGLPEQVTTAVIRDARRTLAPFHTDADPAELVRRAIARQVRIEHGWRTKRRTIALIGAAGSGKTLTAARFCHAYATGSPLAVRTLSLEPAVAAHRLGSLTRHLDIGVRVAESPQAAAEAAARMPGESLIVIDTPAISAGDPEGIAELAAMLEAVRADETHLLVPACSDTRATTRLYEAVTESIPVNRLLLTRVDEVDSAAAAIGCSFTLKRPISYVTSGRSHTAGLRPADAAELAGMVLP